MAGRHGRSEAIRMVAEHTPDVVLMDCQMPGMDGRRRADRAAEKDGQRLPIVAVTAFATSNFRGRLPARRHGPFPALPVSAEDLVSTRQ